MKFLTLYLNNFLVFENEHDIDLSYINSCIVSGINGAGKSTLIIDTILFALYGQARQKGNACITLGKEQGHVKFTFEHNGDIFSIHREVVNKKVSTKLYLYKNNIDISGSTVTETQKIIEEKVLGFSKDLFLTLCCSLQGQIDNFAQQSPQEKQNILSELLRYDIWINRKNESHKILKELNEGIHSLKSQVLLLEDKRKKYVILENELINAQSNLDKYKKIIVSLQEEQEISFEKYQKSRSNKAIIDQLIVSRKNDIDIFEKNAKELQSIQKSKSNFNEENYKNLTILLENNKNELEKNSIVLIGLKEQKEIIEKILFKLNHYKKIEEEVSYIHTVPCKDLDIHDVCPLLKSSLNKNEELKQFIKENEIENLLEHILFNNTLLNNTIKEIKNIESTIFSLQKNIYAVEQKINELTIHNEYLQQTLHKENGLIEHNIKLKESIKNYENRLKECENLEDYEKDYKEKTSLLNACKKQIEDNTIIVSNIKTRQHDLQEEILNLEKIEKQLFQFEQEEKEWKYLISAYDKIPAILLEELIPVIEEEANNILQILNVQYQIKINVFQETKTTQNQRKVLDLVYVTDNGTISFESLSGSEKFKQALALRIALSKTLEYIFGIKIGVFIIDEGFGCLDNEGLQDIKKILEPLSLQFNFFCIITHIEELKDSFDTQIIVHQNVNNKIEIIKN